MTAHGKPALGKERQLYKKPYRNIDWEGNMTEGPWLGIILMSALIVGLIWWILKTMKQDKSK
jgi:hypothetical protein